jgi:hypothetical protein
MKNFPDVEAKLTELRNLCEAMDLPLITLIAFPVDSENTGCVTCINIDASPQADKVRVAEGRPDNVKSHEFLAPLGHLIVQLERIPTQARVAILDDMARNIERTADAAEKMGLLDLARHRAGSNSEMKFDA